MNPKLKDQIRALVLDECHYKVCMELNIRLHRAAEHLFLIQVNSNLYHSIHKQLLVPIRTQIKSNIEDKMLDEIIEAKNFIEFFNE